MGRAGYRTVVATDRHRTRCAGSTTSTRTSSSSTSSLPGLDGWQIIERIREFSRIPILMVTARSSEADKIRGLKLGADDYITKPLSFPELTARVEAALRRAATADPGAPAPAAASRPRRRPRRPPGPPARRGGPPDADRVPPARLSRRARRAARHASPGPRRGLGRRLRRRRPPAADDDPQPAPEARCGRARRVLHRDRVRARLPTHRRRPPDPVTTRAKPTVVAVERDASSPRWPHRLAIGGPGSRNASRPSARS